MVMEEASHTRLAGVKGTHFMQLFSKTMAVTDTVKVHHKDFSGYKRFGCTQKDSAEVLLGYEILFRRSTRFSMS